MKLRLRLAAVTTGLGLGAAILLGPALLMNSQASGQGVASLVESAGVPLQNKKPPETAGETAADVPTQQEVVEIGAVPITVYGVDQQQGTYYGDFYVWVRWNGSINPLESTEIVNSVEKWGTTFTPINEEPISEPDGYQYQSARLDGRFDNNYILSRYPLEEESLALIFENNVYTNSQIAYVPAPASQLQREDNLQVQGWDLGAWTAKSEEYHYKTTFGQPHIENGYSRVTFSLGLSRPSSYFIWKLLLPLLVVILMGLGSLLVAGNYVEVRIGLASTAILAAVFLQLSYTEDLPTVTGLVLMDELYIVAYFVLTAVLARVIYVGYQSKRHKAEDYSTRRGDLLSLAAAVTFLSIGFALVMIFTP